MNLELVGKDVQPSEELRTRLEQKLAKIESRLGQSLYARVAVGRDGDDYSCTIHFTGLKQEFNSAATTDDLYKSADEAVAKIDRQVRRALHKGESHRKPNHSIRNGQDAV